jgi:hypothetical protein
MAIAVLNITITSENERSNKMRFVDLEALSGEENAGKNDVETLSGESSPNPWYLWLSQGLTKDEREYKRKCPTNNSSNSNTTVSISYRGFTGSISYSSTTTNSSDREEITCAYGSTNCTPVNCR